MTAIEVQEIARKYFPGAGLSAVKRLMQAAGQPQIGASFCGDNLKEVVAFIFTTIVFDKELAENYQFKSNLIDVPFRVTKRAMWGCAKTTKLWEGLIRNGLDGLH